MKVRILASFLLAMVVTSGCADKTTLETTPTAPIAAPSRSIPTTLLTPSPSAPTATHTTSPRLPSATATTRPTSALTPTPPAGAHNSDLAISIDPPGAGRVTLAKVGAGVTMEYPRNEEGSADVDSWPAGAVLKLTAYPSVDWVFRNWGRNQPGNPDPISMGTARTITVTVDVKTSITAYFVCEK